MNRHNFFRWLISVFVVGLAIGWSVNGRSEGKRKGPEQVRKVYFTIGDTMLIHKSTEPQTNGIRLSPYAMSRDGNISEWTEAPSEIEKLWVIRVQSASGESFTMTCQLVD